jgi:CPA2 family monovalent cation:H+ antiporter-2
LRTNDQVLLCGSLANLNQLQELLAPFKPVPLSIPVVKAGETEALK